MSTGSGSLTLEDIHSHWLAVQSRTLFYADRAAIISKGCGGAELFVPLTDHRRQYPWYTSQSLPRTDRVDSQPSCGRLNNKSAKVRQQAMDLTTCLAVVIKQRGEDQLLSKLGLVLLNTRGAQV